MFESKFEIEVVWVLSEDGKKFWWILMDFWDLERFSWQPVLAVQKFDFA